MTDQSHASAKAVPFMETDSGFCPISNQAGGFVSFGAVVEFEPMTCVESPLPPDSVLRYQMRRIPRKHSLTRLPAQCHQHGLLPKDLMGATVVSTSQSFLHIRAGPAHPARTLTVLQALPNPGFVSYLRPCPWLPALHPPGLFPALDLLVLFRSGLAHLLVPLP